MMNYFYRILFFGVITWFYIADCITVNDYPDVDEGKKISKKQPHIPILKQSFHQDPHGYHFSYKTGNGIEAEEIGLIKTKGVKEEKFLIKQGKVHYIDEYGHKISLSYVADENGFHAEGDHLPTPPPIPAFLQKAFSEHAQAYAQEEAFHQKYSHQQSEVTNEQNRLEIITNGEIDHNQQQQQQHQLYQQQQVQHEIEEEQHQQHQQQQQYQIQPELYQQQQEQQGQQVHQIEGEREIEEEQHQQQQEYQHQQ